MFFLLWYTERLTVVCILASCTDHGWRNRDSNQMLPCTAVPWASTGPDLSQRCWRWNHGIGKKTITGTFSTSTLCWRKGSRYDKMNHSELSFRTEGKCYDWQEESIQDQAWSIYFWLNTYIGPRGRINVFLVSLPRILRDQLPQEGFHKTSLILFPLVGCIFGSELNGVFCKSWYANITGNLI